MKGVARNILASPRAPSCVLNHFPVDSAVCNPIIGVSPPGKLLFYSRTTRAPGVYRDIPCLPSPRPFPRLAVSDAFLFLAFISLRSSATSMLLFEVYFLFPFFPFFSLALALSLSPFLPLPLSFPSFSGRRESWKRIQSSFRSVKEYR